MLTVACSLVAGLALGLDFG